jgi:hypothetical protein
MVKHECSTDQDNPQLFLIGNTGRSSTVIMQVANAATPVVTYSSVPTLDVDYDSGGPTSGRSMKVGFKLQNYAPALDLAGAVHVLQSKQRVFLPAAFTSMTQANWSTVIAEIRSHPDSLILSGKELSKGLSFFSHPVDTTAYNEFGRWLGSSNSTFSSFAATWTSASENPRAMSFYWVVFDKCTPKQDYVFTVHSSYYTRWPLNSVLAQHQVQTPVVRADVASSQRLQAETQSGVPTPAPVGGGSIASGLRGAAMSAANAVARNAAGAIGNMARDELRRRMDYGIDPRMYAIGGP